MPRTKHVSNGKNRKEAVAVLGVVSMSLSLAGGSSAAAAAPAMNPSARPVAPSLEITLHEEEVADVSLATFYVWDKENVGAPRLGVRVAGGCGCGCGCGCGGCGCGGCAASQAAAESAGGGQGCAHSHGGKHHGGRRHGS